jgi:hypothetical protein
VVFGIKRSGESDAFNWRARGTLFFIPPGSYPGPRTVPCATPQIACLTTGNRPARLDELCNPPHGLALLIPSEGQPQIVRPK